MFTFSAAMGKNLFILTGKCIFTNLLWEYNMEYKKIFLITIDLGMCALNTYSHQVQEVELELKLELEI
jgi:hypothetical protein